jgi:hypothetical protein
MPGDELVQTSSALSWSLEEIFLLQIFCGALDDANGFGDE